MNTPKFPLVVSILLCSLLATSCATGLRHTTESTQEDAIEAPKIQEKPVIGEEIYGPPLPPVEQPVEQNVPLQTTPTTPVPPTQGSAIAPLPVLPEPIVNQPKICVVLGPGMAKAIAEAAVLEVLVKAGLPIRCVVGTEMGAVVGALYASANGGTNSLQWELFKFNKDNYFNFSMFSLHDSKSSGRRLNEELSTIFSGKSIESLPLQFATVATDTSSGAAIPLREGNLANVLSASLAIPGIFEPWKLGNQTFASGAVSSPLPMDLAASLGSTFLIAVNVVDDIGASATSSDERFQRAFLPVRNLLRFQKKEAKELIQVRIQNINYDDFTRQAEILAAGREAAEKSVDKIKADWDAEFAAFNSAHGISPLPTTTEQH